MRNAQCRPRGVAKRDFSYEAALFKVLSDPHRLKIFAIIAAAEDEVCVCDLTAGLPLEQPTVSHHLKVLRENGLVLSERRGTWVYYRVAAGALDALQSTIGQIALGNATRKALRKTG